MQAQHTTTNWRGVQDAAEALNLARAIVFRWLRSPLTDKGKSGEAFRLVYYQSLCILLVATCDPLAPPHSVRSTYQLLKTTVFVDITCFRDAILSQRSMRDVPRYSSPGSLRKALLINKKLYQKDTAMLELLDPLLIDVNGHRGSSSAQSRTSRQTSYASSYRPWPPRSRASSIKQEEREYTATSERGGGWRSERYSSIGDDMEILDTSVGNYDKIGVRAWLS